MMAFYKHVVVYCRVSLMSWCMPKWLDIHIGLPRWWKSSQMDMMLDFLDPDITGLIIMIILLIKILLFYLLN